MDPVFITAPAVRHGSTAPTASVGNNGDFYIRPVASADVRLYGPKASDAWPSTYVQMASPISLTPWTSNIDAANYSLATLGPLTFGSSGYIDLSSRNLGIGTATVTKNYSASTPHTQIVKIVGALVLGGVGQGVNDDGLIQMGAFGFMGANNWSGINFFGCNYAIRSTSSADTRYTPLTHASLGYAGIEVAGSGSGISFLVGSGATTAGATVTPTAVAQITGTGLGVGYLPITKLDVRDAYKAPGTHGNVNIATSDPQGAGIGGVLAFGGSITTASPLLNVRGFGFIRGAKENSAEADTSGYLAFYTMPVYSITPVERLRIASTGYVGIGQASPGYLLHLGSDSAAKPSTNTWTISSDVRIKAVQGEFTDGLSVIRQLRPVVYRYNGRDGSLDDGEHRSILAQEAETAIPYCIGEYQGKLDGETTTLKNLNTSDLTWVIVNALKELDARLEALEN